MPQRLWKQDLWFCREHAQVIPPQLWAQDHAGGTLEWLQERLWYHLRLTTTQLKAGLCSSNSLWEKCMHWQIGFMESHEHLDWKGPWRSAKSKPPSPDKWHHFTRFRAPSKLALSSCRDGAPTASLGTGGACNSPHSRLLVWMEVIFQSASIAALTWLCIKLSPGWDHLRRVYSSRSWTWPGLFCSAFTENSAHCSSSGPLSRTETISF